MTETPKSGSADKPGGAVRELLKTIDFRDGYAEVFELPRGRWELVVKAMYGDNSWTYLRAINPHTVSAAASAGYVKLGHWKSGLHSPHDYCWAPNVFLSGRQAAKHNAHDLGRTLHLLDAGREAIA